MRSPLAGGRSGRSFRNNTYQPGHLRLTRVGVPTEIPNTAAVFIFLRKMRGPLLLVLTVMSAGVLGLSLMPGDLQPNGASGQLSTFEAFYVFTITMTTIGFGEVPHSFSVYQRIWLTGSIYVCVLTWAYTLARLMSLLQDSAFIAARTAQSVKRTIAHLREPFIIIVGYGFIGRTVARTLDLLGRRIVVVDNSTVPIERLATDLMRQEVPGVTGDARSPAILGLAGLDHPDCTAVLAMAGDEEVNLQVVMTCSLLRPDLPVIAKAATTKVAQQMANFSPMTIINPYDDYGNFLVLSMQKPYTYRLLTWLVAVDGTALPPIKTHLPVHLWLVVADGQFGDEICRDLRANGYKVVLATPSADLPLRGVDAVVLGAESDTTNLALAAEIRRDHPEVFLAVRQQSHSHLPLLEAFTPDSVFFPPALVTRRAVSNLITPYFWNFVEELFQADDAWSRQVTERIVARVGPTSPMPRRLTIGAEDTPAVARWLKHRPLAMETIFRTPLDWHEKVAAFPLLLIRDGGVESLPSEETPLKLGDQVLMIGGTEAFDEQTEALYDDSTLYYVATGQDIPTSQAWRRLTHQRWRDAFPVPGDADEPAPTAGTADTTASPAGPPEPARTNARSPAAAGRGANRANRS